MPRHPPKRRARKISSKFKRYYDRFRARGYSPAVATDYARALHYADGHDLNLRTEYEEDRYEDVYGEPPPSGVEFIRADLVDAHGKVVDSLGFVENDPGSLEDTKANMVLEYMRRPPR